MATAPILIVNAFGVGAALCSMSSFVPQIIKMVKEHDAEGVSLGMWLVTVAGFVLWIAYGTLSGSWPVAVSNVINLVLAAAILTLKLRIDSQTK